MFFDSDVPFGTCRMVACASSSTTLRLLCSSFGLHHVLIKLMFWSLYLLGMFLLDCLEAVVL
jgi:hypothetical protein